MGSMGGARFTIEWERRLCKAGSRTGYFHCWEHRVCGDQGQVYGIVEFTDGVQRVEPEDIVFLDEANAGLHCFAGSAPPRGVHDEW